MKWKYMNGIRVYKIFPECVGILNMCETYCYFK